MKCVHCGKWKRHHKAGTLACPVGTKTRVGYVTWSSTRVFLEKLDRRVLLTGHHRATYQRGCPEESMLLGCCPHVLKWCGLCRGPMCGCPAGEARHLQRSRNRLHWVK